MVSPSALESACRLSAAEQYAAFVNPQWVRLLNLLQMNVQYVQCRGAELYTADGRSILDFLSGYCVHNLGHNHPRVVAALQRELECQPPAMLQSHVPQLAGELAFELCRRAGGRSRKVFFCSSGSEGVESAIKFARAHTGRSGLLYCSGAFHGLTCGALSLMGSDFWRSGFGPLLPDCQEIPFNDVAALERALASGKIAAFVVEPVQGEGGIRVPDADYLKRAGQLCRHHGAVLVLDEVQTGLGRTGRFLAAHHFQADPDIVILAKALSGGLIPVAAVLVSDAVHDSIYGSLDRAIIHTSTYSENTLAMRAGLATLEVLEEEALAERAAGMGKYLRQWLTEALGGYEMVAAVRGMGLMCGIEFTAPKQLRLRLPFESFRKIHPGMFGQMLVMRFFRDHRILTQICGNNFNVLKVAPPLTINEEQLEYFVRAAQAVVEAVHSSAGFWSDALGLGQRAVGL